MLSRIFIDFLCPPDNHLMHTHVTVNIYFKEIVKKKIPDRKIRTYIPIYLTKF